MPISSWVLLLSGQRLSNVQSLYLAYTCLAHLLQNVLRLLAHKVIAEY